jgi:phospholipase/carboxylesterase
MVALAGVFMAPASQRAPSCLIVLCHGAHTTGEAMKGMGKVLAELLPDAALAAPHGPLVSSSRPPTREWFAPPYAEPHIGPRVVEAAVDLDDFIDAQLAAARLPPGAYALGGFSQGAIVALQAGLRRRVPPRAIVAVAGILVNALPPVVPAVPVQLVSGVLDTTVATKRVRDTEQALRAAGLDVEAQYVPGLGHEVTPVVIGLGAKFLQRVLAGG